MSRNPSRFRKSVNHPVISLLHTLADEHAVEREIAVDDATAAWVMRSGLGPILWSRVKHAPGQLSENALLQLKTADLSARMLSAVTFDALETILDHAGRNNCPVTLLKGVSVAQQYYPQRHWRLMRDIDLLVEAEDQSRLEQILRDLGFSQRSEMPPSFFAGHHHSMPFYHPQLRCWVEVHKALVLPHGEFSHVRAFQPDALRVERRQLAHDSASLWRLSNELQLVYTAVHWGAKLQIIGGLVPVVDTILLLKSVGRDLDWERVLTMCRDITAARYLALMIAYLVRHDLCTVPTEVWAALARGRRNIGFLGMKILLDSIDDYLVDGRPLDGFVSAAILDTGWSTLLEEGNPWLKLLKLPWRTAFPPDSTNRYDLLRHRQRLKSLLQRIR